MALPTSLGKILLTTLLLSLLQLAAAGPVSAEPADPKLSNDRCLRCHGREGFSREGPDGQERNLHVVHNTVERRQSVLFCFWFR